MSGWVKKEKWGYEFTAKGREKAIAAARAFGKSFPSPASDTSIGFTGVAVAYNSGPVAAHPWVGNNRRKG